jgi:hypothetical protein
LDEEKGETDEDCEAKLDEESDWMPYIVIIDWMLSLTM